MKIAFCTAAVVAVLGLSASTASAQYQSVIPHRGHYHVAPTYSPPVATYNYPAYSPGVTFGGVYSTPGISMGGSFSQYGGGYYTPQPSYNYNGYGGYGGHSHHHHHGHHR